MTPLPAWDARRRALTNQREATTAAAGGPPASEIPEIPEAEPRPPADTGLLDLLKGRVGQADHAPISVLSAAVVAWVVVMGRLILMRQRNFGTFDFDEGIYDQYLWQLAHFRLFNTVQGVPLDGHHASLAFILLVPLVWLGGGVGTWDILQTMALAGTAFPLVLPGSGQAEAAVARLRGGSHLAGPAVGPVVRPRGLPP